MKEINVTNWKAIKEEMKKKLQDLPDEVILTVPLVEEEEAFEVRTRKRLNSYSERAAALMR